MKSPDLIVFSDVPYVIDYELAAFAQSNFFSLPFRYPRRPHQSNLLGRRHQGIHIIGYHLNLLQFREIKEGDIQQDNVIILMKKKKKPEEFRDENMPQD